MLKNKNDIYNENYKIEDNDVIKRKLKVKKLNKFLNHKIKLFIIGIILSWIISIIFYFNNDSNNIRKITITNNHYLKDEYVIKQSGLTLDNSYLFFNKYDVIKELINSPYIKDAKITHDKYNIINIEIEEAHLVAYQFNDKPTILTKDAETIEIDKEFEYLISYYPLLFGNYNQELISNICKGLSEVDSTILENISEIEPYETTYDNNMLRLLMRDNRFLFTSTLSLEPINYYYDIVKELEEDEVCLYVIEISNHIYSSACPWEVQEEQEEENEEEES